MSEITLMGYRILESLLFAPKGKTLREVVTACVGADVPILIELVSLKRARLVRFNDSVPTRVVITKEGVVAICAQRPRRVAQA